jgi:hypothetical protein
MDREHVKDILRGLEVSANDFYAKVEALKRKLENIDDDMILNQCGEYTDLIASIYGIELSGERLVECSYQGKTRDRIG